MPRYDHRVDALTQLTPGEATVLAMIIEELNLLRQQVGLAPRTPEDVHQMVQKAYRPMRTQAGDR